MRAVALAVLLAGAALLASREPAQAAAPPPPVVRAVAAPGAELSAAPQLQPGPSQSASACAGAALVSGVAVGAIGTPIAGVAASIIVGSGCALNAVTGGVVTDFASGPLLSGVEFGLTHTVGVVLRDALKAVLEAFFGALGPDGNVISQTPPGLTYELGAIKEMHRYSTLLAAMLLAGIVMWGGYNVMLRQSTNSPYHGALQLFGRVVLAAILIALSMPLMSGMITVNNVVICYFGDIVEFTTASGVETGICATHEGATTAHAVPPGFETAFSGSDGLLDIAFGLAYGLVLIVLIILMVMRIGLIDVLIVLAPIAALLWILPQTQGWTRRWTNIFPLTVFQQAVQMLVMALGVVLASTAAGAIAGGSLTEANLARAERGPDCSESDSQAVLAERRANGDAYLCALIELQAQRAALDTAIAELERSLASHERALAGEGGVPLPVGEAELVSRQIGDLRAAFDAMLHAEYDNVVEYAATQSPQLLRARNARTLLRGQIDRGEYVSGDRLARELRAADDAALLLLLRLAGSPEFDCTFRESLGDSGGSEDWRLREPLCLLDEHDHYDGWLDALTLRVSSWTDPEEYAKRTRTFMQADIGGEVVAAAQEIADEIAGTTARTRQPALLVMRAGAVPSAAPALRAQTASPIVTREALEQLVAREHPVLQDTLDARAAAAATLDAHYANGGAASDADAATTAQEQLAAAEQALARELARWLPSHLQVAGINPYADTHGAIELIFGMAVLWLVIRIPGILNGDALRAGFQELMPIYGGLRSAAAPAGALAAAGLAGGGRALGRAGSEWRHAGGSDVGRGRAAAMSLQRDAMSQFSGARDSVTGFGNPAPEFPAITRQNYEAEHGVGSFAALSREERGSLTETAQQFSSLRSWQRQD